MNAIRIQCNRHVGRGYAGNCSSFVNGSCRLWPESVFGLLPYQVHIKAGVLINGKQQLRREINIILQQNHPVSDILFLPV